MPNLCFIIVLQSLQYSHPSHWNYNSIIVIDNIFIDTAKFEKFTVISLSLTNGLSDHNVQIIAIHMLHGPSDVHWNGYTSNINKHTIAQFHYNLSFESWGSVFDGCDVFNTFIYTFFKNLLFKFSS
jgi:hypothetical protein